MLSSFILPFFLNTDCYAARYTWISPDSLVQHYTLDLHFDKHENIGLAGNQHATYWWTTDGLRGIKIRFSFTFIYLFLSVICLTVCLSVSFSGLFMSFLLHFPFFCVISYHSFCLSFLNCIFFCVVLSKFL